MDGKRVHARRPLISQWERLLPLFATIYTPYDCGFSEIMLTSNL